MKKPRITYDPQRVNGNWVVEAEYNHRATCRASYGDGVVPGLRRNWETQENICGLLWCETLPQAVAAADRYCKIASLPPLPQFFHARSHS